MPYTKQNFINGNVLNAEQLIVIEDAILELQDSLADLKRLTDSDTNSPIKYVESTDTSNLLNLRDFESGTYILSGKFHPYAGSTASISFTSALLVNIITKTAGTHVQVFYPVNNCVQFLNITDDSYERTNIYLNELLENIENLQNKISGTIITRVSYDWDINKYMCTHTASEIKDYFDNGHTVVAMYDDYNIAPLTSIHSNGSVEFSRVDLSSDSVNQRFYTVNDERVVTYSEKQLSLT